MKKIKFKINNNILKSYVDTINSIQEPMSKIKEQIIYLTSPTKKGKTLYKSKKIVDTTNKIIPKTLEPIIKMNEQLKKYSIKYPNSQTKIFIDVIQQIMIVNKGMITTRMIEPLNISRQYLSIMEKNKDIEKISRGTYISPSTFEDSYFSFQQKYKKTIFSHMNALYFFDMTEEFPYNYTVTVQQNYHADTVNEKCNVFYVSKEIFEMGVTEVETPSGNKVRVYDKERCICDIIRSKDRMDSEQVKKVIKQYIQSRDKDLAKLSKYSKKMKINKKVMEMVGEAYYE